MIGLSFIGLGIGLFLGAWWSHNRFVTTKEIYLELGRLAFWLVVLGIIFLSAGV